MTAAILIVGDFNSAFAPHGATNAALEHSRAALGVELDFRWTPPSQFDEAGGLDHVRQAAGLLIAPGSPYSSLHGTLAAIQIARTESIPLLGTCGGFQHVILEFARNVLGVQDAAHAEYDPYASRLIVSKLDCSLAGKRLPIALTPDSQVARIYGRTQIEEEYYCNFGLNPDYIPLLRVGNLNIVGTDCAGEVRVVELPSHRFFVGTLFVPQMRSTPSAPHPLVTELVRQSANRA